MKSMRGAFARCSLPATLVAEALSPVLRAWFLLILPVLPAVAHAELVQQGAKLTGTGAVGDAGQGWSVAISGDGNTALVGGPVDNGAWSGAAWVFVRNNGAWSQQGPKLVGAGTVNAAWQGVSVALSADGNTAVVGGQGDEVNAGATWVFARTGSVWSQQGDKLVAADQVGAAGQGNAVAVSADGNTIIVGGPGDDGNIGAAWIFVRSGNSWSQQGAKLVGSGAVGLARQGISVAISADGNTAVVGGPIDDDRAGAAWVFVRNGGTWTQQGTKLVGTGAVGNARQGNAVAVSADGNTIAVGGPEDDGEQGAAWIHVRSGDTWSQQGDKLLANDASGINPSQGSSIAISGNGNKVLLGGEYDDGGFGAAWIFERDGEAWSQQGSKMVGSGAEGYAQQGGSVALSADGNTAVVGARSDDFGAGAAWMFAASPTLDVESAGVQGALVLSAPRPNPARVQTVLSFVLPASEHVALAVYDLAGRRVRMLKSARLEAGRHEMPFDLMDEHGRPIPNGLYLVNLVTERGSVVRRVAVLR